jgi:hypothetical protein
MDRVRQYLTDVGDLNWYLAEAAGRCIFKANGLCQVSCPVRPYCRPHVEGLADVEDLNED